MIIRPPLAWSTITMCLLLHLTTAHAVGQESPSGNLAANQDSGAAKSSAPYSRWTHGPRFGNSQFPIAVWLQAPRNAAQYKELGINLYVALWEGPTEQQIDELRRHGMPVVCSQNDYALHHLEEQMIVGWMHGDEPDNAQPLGRGKGYGPPILPARIIEDYQRIKARDSSRPILLNLGQGVAWDGWHGRGVRSNHPEDYAQYVRGGDIVSFDIYPAVHDNRAVAGKLWYVARGVTRLREWAGDQRLVWNCIECTRISNEKTKPTPQQVKAEVWMSIIHGSQGIIYFCHQFQPRFIEAGLLADKEMAEAVGKVNQRIQSLAPVILSPAVPGMASVQCQPAEVSDDMATLLGRHSIAFSTRQHRGKLFLFAVRMEQGRCSGTFQIKTAGTAASVRVIGEDRTLDLRSGQFTDDFDTCDVHLYEIDLAAD